MFTRLNPSDRERITETVRIDCNGSGRRNHYVKWPPTRTRITTGLIVDLFPLRSQARGSTTRNLRRSNEKTRREKCEQQVMCVPLEDDAVDTESVLLSWSITRTSCSCKKWYISSIWFSWATDMRGSSRFYWRENRFSSCESSHSPCDTQCCVASIMLCVTHAALHPPPPHPPHILSSCESPELF